MPDPFHDHPASRAVLPALARAHGLDLAQADAVLAAARRKARHRGGPPTTKSWQALLARHADAAASPADRDAVASCRDLPVPDPATFAALDGAHGQAVKAVKALRRQVQFAAAVQGVAEQASAALLPRLRDAHAGQAVPACWRDGFTGRDTMSMSAPDDPATLWALWRMQSDPALHPTARRLGYASVDLETAGPPGRTGFEPANGSIIEAGVVLYDNDGTETGRVGGLIAAAPRVLALCGTGSVDVHRITPDMLVGAPGWDRAAPALARAVAGRVMVSHHIRYERRWLQHHMRERGVPFDAWGPQLDTVCLAKQHAGPLGSWKLDAVCAAVGVPYTDGHRAMHDAAAAGQALFVLRAAARAGHAAQSRAAARPGDPVPSPGRAMLGP